MKKLDLAKALSDRLGLTQAQSKEAVDILLNTIEEALINGDSIEIGGFGKLEVKERAGRTGVNPSTKERIDIPAFRNVSFRAAKALKTKLNK